MDDRTRLQALESALADLQSQGQPAPSRKSSSRQVVSPPAPFWVLEILESTTAIASGTDVDTVFDVPAANARLISTLPTAHGALEFQHEDANPRSARLRLVFDSDCAFTARTWITAVFGQIQVKINGRSPLNDGTARKDYGAGAVETWQFDNGRNVLSIGMANDANELVLMTRILGKRQRFVDTLG